MSTELQVNEPNITPIKERLSLLVSGSLSLTVTDEESQKIAGARILSLRDAIKQVETERHSWTDPIEAHKKKLMGIFKPVLTELEFAESHLKQQLGAYFMKQKEAERKEQERLQKLAQKRFDSAQAAGRPTAFPVPIAPVVQMVEKSIQTEAGKITYVPQLKPYISEHLPDYFYFQGKTVLIVDMVAIRKMITDKEITKENKPDWLILTEESYIRG